MVMNLTESQRNTKGRRGLSSPYCGDEPTIRCEQKKHNSNPQTEAASNEKGALRFAQSTFDNEAATATASPDGGLPLHHPLKTFLGIVRFPTHEPPCGSCSIRLFHRHVFMEYMLAERRTADFAVFERRDGSA